MVFGISAILGLVLLVALTCRFQAACCSPRCRSCCSSSGSRASSRAARSEPCARTGASSTTRAGGGMARKWWTLLVVCVGSFMLLLDVTIVNVALPEIEADLGATLTDLQWVVDSYVLAARVAGVDRGLTGDRLGRRRVFVAGLGLFTLASLLAGFASDPLQLELARGLQGIGGAGMFGTVLALIAQEFPVGERVVHSEHGARPWEAAVAVGPLVGGLVVENLGWEWSSSSTSRSASWPWHWL